MSSVSVRYIVDDVYAAIASYTERLGFELKTHPAPGFAMLARDGLNLLLNAPRASAAPDRPWPTARFRGRAAGTGSSSLSPTSPER